MANYSVDALKQALITKGGYNEADAANAASNVGGRADELAKEFLGVSSSGTSTGSGVGDYLDTYQQTLYNKLGEAVDSIPTIEEVTAQVTPTLALPETISRVDILEQQKEKYGVTGLETELTGLNTEINTINADLRTLTGQEEGKPVELSLMQGRITEEQRQAYQKLDYLNVRKQTLVDQISTAYNAINTYVQYAGLDYQDAVQAYNDEFQRNLSIQNLMSSLRSEKITGISTQLDIYTQAKQQAITNAQANLSTITNAILSGNTTYDSLNDETKLQIQKLETQAGMPVGTISSLQLAPKDKIMAFSSDNTEAMIVNSDGSFSVIKTGLTPKAEKSTQTEVKQGYIDEVKAAAQQGESFRDILAVYSGLLSPEEIYQLYNSTSKWGAVQIASGSTKTSEDIANQRYTKDELLSLGIKLDSNNQPIINITK